MTDLQILYADCAYYLSGEDAQISAKSIIENAVSVLPITRSQALKNAWEMCVWHANNWNNLSIGDLIAEEYFVLEELCAALGEYYAERSAL